MPHPSDDMAVLEPLIVATVLTVGTIVIHAFALSSVVRLVRREGLLGHLGVRFWRDVAIVAGVTLVALAAHLTEVALWAAVLAGLGEFSGFASAFYHSAESYTTLGGDGVIMPAAWKLLEPLEAADGMLMFGVSIAMIFAVIQRMVQIRYPEPGNATEKTKRTTR